MQNHRTYPTVTVTRKGESFIRGGHVWVYEGEVVAHDPDIANGQIVDVVTEKNRYLGSGFYNSRSKIRVRILSGNANDTFDTAFWERRVRYAVEYRRTVMGSDFRCCRLIFGEADGFPGLTVDRFEDVLVAECACLGTDQRLDIIFRALLDELRRGGDEIRVIYRRDEAPLREIEGLPQFKGYYAADGLATEASGHVRICENGVTYDVDYVDGQKTGFFLDQKYNRQAVARYCRGRHVLDCFTHTGAFALNAAMGGAASVTAVDISEHALDCARQNAALSGLAERVTFCREDVFDLLTRMDRHETPCPYDFIILDPPAFTKAGATRDNAYRGYKDINRRAMRLLPRGGYLATCSCSRIMTDELFRKMLRDAALDAHVSLRQIEGRQQAPDHPILWNVPETEYLKFYLFQVI